MTNTKGTFKSLVLEEFDNYSKHKEVFATLRGKLKALYEEHKENWDIEADYIIINVLTVLNDLIRECGEFDDCGAVAFINCYYNGEFNIDDTFGAKRGGQLKDKFKEMGIDFWWNSTWHDIDSKEIVRETLPFGDIDGTLAYFKDRIKLHERRYAAETISK